MLRTGLWFIPSWTQVGFKSKHRSLAQRQEGRLGRGHSLKGARAQRRALKGLCLRVRASLNAGPPVPHWPQPSPALIRGKKPGLCFWSPNAPSQSRLGAHLGFMDEAVGPLASTRARFLIVRDKEVLHWWIPPAPAWGLVS